MERCAQEEMDLINHLLILIMLDMVCVANMMPLDQNAILEMKLSAVNQHLENKH